jgi:hypothetical protein
MCDDGRGLSNGLGRESVCAHAVERAGLRIEDGLLSRLKLLAGNGGLQTKLQFRFGGTEERLIDLRLIGVQGDVGADAIGVALEDDLILGADLKECSELQKDKRVSESACSCEYQEQILVVRLPPAYPESTE